MSHHYVCCLLRLSGYQGWDYVGYETPQVVEQRADSVLGQLRRSLDSTGSEEPKGTKRYAALASTDMTVRKRAGRYALDAFADGSRAALALGHGCVPCCSASMAATDELLGWRWPFLCRSHVVWWLIQLWYRGVNCLIAHTCPAWI